jgi:hypothetical protein
MLLELRNDFHDSKATVRCAASYARDEGTLILQLSDRQRRRLWINLCGRQGCTCSSLATAGTRGPQFDSKGRRLIVLPSRM